MQLAPKSQTNIANWYLITEHHDASLKIRSGIVLGCDHLNQLSLESSREVIALDVSPMGHLNLRLVSDLFVLRTEDMQSLSHVAVEPGQAIQLRYLDTKLLLATDLAYVQKIDVLKLDLTPVATNLFNFPFKKSLFGREANPGFPAVDVAGSGSVAARAGQLCGRWLDQLSGILDPGLRAPLLAVAGFIFLLFLAPALDQAQPGLARTHSGLSTADGPDKFDSGESPRIGRVGPMIVATEKVLVLGPIEYWNMRFPSSPLESGIVPGVPDVSATAAIDAEICIGGAFESYAAFDAFDAFEMVPIETASLSQTQQSPDHAVSAEEKYAQTRTGNRSGVRAGATKSGRKAASVSESKGRQASDKRAERINLNAKSIPLNTIGGSLPTPELVDENSDASGMSDVSLPPGSTISLPLTELTVVSSKAPVYPRFRGRIDIDVEIRFTVDVQGRVRDLVTTGDPPKRFARAATRAVRRWRFEPYLSAGQPTPVRTTVRFSFNN